MIYFCISASKMKVSQAVQGLETRIEELETRNQELKTWNQVLETRNKRYETQNRELERQNKRIETQNQELEARVKELESQNKILAKGAKSLMQEVRQNGETPKRPTFTTPMNLSSELADIIGKKKASCEECIKEVYAYIKKNNLHDPKNKELFIPDKKIAKVIDFNIFDSCDLTAYP